MSEPRTSDARTADPDREHDFTETTVASKVTYRGRMLEVREDEVRLPDGNPARREYVVHPGAAVIMPIFDDWSVLLERQFRYPLHDHFYEFPAGITLEIQGPKREFLLPFRKAFVPETHREARVLVVDPPAGLLDD